MKGFVLNTKDKIRNFAYYAYNNQLFRNHYDMEIQKRRRLSVTNIENLAKPINLYSPVSGEIHKSNDWYGHATVFKKFLGYPKKSILKSVIEHGVFLCSEVTKADINPVLPSYITYSDYRIRYLKRYKKNVYNIGPFIHYANHYLSRDKLKREKKRLGKNLLFFPSHSAPGLTYLKDNIKLCKKIQKLGKNFNTIRICLYWSDILQNIQDVYKSFGFECVTAGHVLDPNFLPRLKSIIYSSTFTASNDAGTHVGYCVYLNKAHFIDYQKPKLTGAKNLINLTQKYWKAKPYNEVLKCFSKLENNPTRKQKSIIDKYWGTGNVKTKKELNIIFRKSEELYKQAKL